MTLRAAVFDVGETLFSEARAWAAWADWLGVDTRELGAALGATIERRADHRSAFELIRPGFDLPAEQAARRAAGLPDDPCALYDRHPDVLPALAAGMVAVHLRRGPWGIVQATWPGAARADVRADSLLEVAEALLRL